MAAPSAAELEGGDGQPGAAEGAAGPAQANPAQANLAWARPIRDDEFAACMRGLGPWEGLLRIGVGVSGGPDSLACALLLDRWARARQAQVVALVIDHALREASASEAGLTCRRLAALGLEVRIGRLDGLARGPRLAERARAARYARLAAMARDLGLLDLVLGHHAGDQAETVLMRSRAGSGPGGLAGMALLVETDALRLLRPLLATPPARLRATLCAQGLGWIEDPSNRDRAALRTRLREELAATPTYAARLLGQARRRGGARMQAEKRRAAWLAAHAVLRPQGFALLPEALVDADALAALIQAVAGRDYPPPMRQVRSLGSRPHAATLAGARLTPAGRLGPGWLLLREAAAMPPPVAAAPGVVWDGRFRLTASRPAAGLLIGAAPAAGGRGGLRDGLPGSVRATLPGLLDASGAVVAGVEAFEFCPPGCAGLGGLFQAPDGAARTMQNKSMQNKKR